VQVAPPLAAEAAGSAQLTEPEPQSAGGSTKKEKEKLRKERQRQRKMDEAWALRGAMERMEETAGAGSVDAVEEAMQAAAKHEARSEPLAALVAEAREVIEQARAAEAERARVAAEEAAVEAAAKAAVSTAAKAEAAAERLRLEEEVAALTLGMQRDALRLQQAQQRLGLSGGTRAPPRCGGDDVRGVHGRSQGPGGAAMHARVRV
jgi:membrane protein involved in colicin uptake